MAKYSSCCVGDHADSKSTAAGNREVLHVSVLHAGVDGDDTDMALVTKTDDGNHIEDIHPLIRIGLDVTGLMITTYILGEDK